MIVCFVTRQAEPLVRVESSAGEMWSMSCHTSTSESAGWWIGCTRNGMSRKQRWDVRVCRPTSTSESLDWWIDCAQNGSCVSHWTHTLVIMIVRFSFIDWTFRTIFYLKLFIPQELCSRHSTWERVEHWYAMQCLVKFKTGFCYMVGICLHVLLV